MAYTPYKPDIEYIQQYYTYGSEAKVIEFKPIYRKPEKKQTAKKPQTEQKRIIYIDPVAFCGLMMAVVMLVVMAAGIIQYDIACDDHKIMEDYLISLRDQNVQLHYSLRTDYDMEEVKGTALALGMIPIEDAQTLTVKVTVPEPEAERTVWDDIVWFFSGLFE